MNKRHIFTECVEANKISDTTVQFIESWAKSVTLEPNNSFKRAFISPQNKFQIWNARIADPDSRKGKSGGFRLLCFFVKDGAEVYLDLIESRKDLGFGKEHPKDKQKYTRYLESLKSELLSIYET